MSDDSVRAITRLDTTGDMLGTVGRDIVNLLLLSSLFACVLSIHNVIVRYRFVLAGKGLLPARLAMVHDDHEASSFSSVVQTVTAAIIVAVLAILGIDPLVGVLGSMAGIATVGMVMLMLTTSITVLCSFCATEILPRDGCGTRASLLRRQCSAFSVASGWCCQTSPW